jgi:hypothetical protein
MSNPYDARLQVAERRLRSLSNWVTELHAKVVELNLLRERVRIAERSAQSLPTTRARPMAHVRTPAWRYSTKRLPTWTRRDPA